MREIHAWTHDKESQSKRDKSCVSGGTENLSRTSFVNVDTLAISIFSLFHIWEVDASVCESCEWLLGPLRAFENPMRSKP